MHKTNCYWRWIFLLYILLSFTRTVTTFQNNFSQTFMPFPLRLYSIGNKNQTFSIGAKFKHWIQFEFLSIAFRTAYAIFRSNHSRVFFEIGVLSNSANRTHWINIWTHYNDREDHHYHLSDVKLMYC